MSDDVRAHLWVTGRVQGVFFRATCKEEGVALGLRGWVRNTPEGGVEAVAEGPREHVDAFIRWCHKGPPAARVQNVRVEWETPQSEKPFHVTV